ncbi:MAG: hypothetical protein HY953_00785, partial [Candidatus Rokubacteria bacterium]|nr:hypothetical protein [Candidatus Rokubacteria bacterium]
MTKADRNQWQRLALADEGTRCSRRSLSESPVPGSDRLLKLTVDLGGERRSVVGGLAQSYAPEELRGLKVIVVANL